MSIRMSAPTQYRSNIALNDGQINYYAPSVFAHQAHDSRGDKYAFIPTIDVLNALRDEGFEPFEVRQTRTRDKGKREFTKHMLRLRHPTALKTDEGHGEIILLNSHDGSSSFQLMSGFFRMVCSNGIIAGDVAANCRVRHTGRVVDDVIEASYRVVDDLQTVGSRIEAYKAVPMDRPHQEIFAAAALQLRYGDEAPVQSSKLLALRRWEDNRDDLWTTFNRVQENMLKGGLGGRTSNGRRMSTRAVSGVTENVKLNAALWTLADEYAKLAA